MYVYICIYIYIIYQYTLHICIHTLSLSLSHTHYSQMYACTHRYYTCLRVVAHHDTTDKNGHNSCSASGVSALIVPQESLNRALKAT